MSKKKKGDDLIPNLIGDKDEESLFRCIREQILVVEAQKFPEKSLYGSCPESS